MKAKLLGTFVSFMLLIGSIFPIAGITAAAAAGSMPFLVKGPLATPINETGPGYGLFACQVGLSTGQCYDPYQMRNAYGISSLISAGMDGTGKTIVIIDAFQDPNILSQLNFFDNFYGLTNVNAGTGTPTFTQVAPDGLTPFVTGDPNMTGWAEEISLDVLWAHAIAPGAINTAMLAEVIEAGATAGPEYEAAVRRRATGGDSTAPIEELVVYLAAGDDGGSLSGKLIAAQHDDWQDLATRGEAITSSDWYTLRRVDPATLRRLPTLGDGRS